MPFFKIDNGNLLIAPKFVATPAYTLEEADHATYTYPHDGWYWFANEADATSSESPIGLHLTPSGLPTRVYDPEDPAHLRIYGVDGMPGDLSARYLPTNPPLEYDWGLLGLQKEKLFGPGDHGDIPEYLYTNEAGVPVCRRLFAFDYEADANGAWELTVGETPGWARNNGTWVDGPTKRQVYRGIRYNAWRDEARVVVYGGLKTWCPLVLVALEVVADIPAGESLLRLWLGTNHAAPWSMYMSTGDKTAITATLTADTTAWLDEVIPANVIDVPANTTVRAMILGALR